MKRTSLFFFCLFLIAGLASCKQPTVTPTPEPTQTALPSETPELIPTNTLESISQATPATEVPLLTPTLASTVGPISYGPSEYPLDVNPLTGLKIDNPALLERRPIAIKINIIPRYSTRPPWGLSQADIVYDYYHNDGYSRFYTIFYGEDVDLVGPIRSGRLLDVDLTRMYQSIFAYGSADPAINNRLLNSEFSNRLILEGERSLCPPTPQRPMCRFEPTGVDILLAGTQALSQHITDQGVDNGRQDLKGMYFHEDTPSGGSAANQLYLRYSGDNYIRWDYDPATEHYLRFQDNVFDQGQGEAYAPLLDRNNNQQIAAENVVIILARHEYYRQPPGEIVEILLSGTGSGYALRDGQIFRVSWERPTIYSVLSLRMPDGTPYPFKPGKTWFQIIGANSVSSQPGEGTWRFEFKMP